MKRIGVILAIALSIFVVGCSSSHTTHLTAKVQCAVAYHKWDKAGGLANLQKLRNAVPPMVTAAEKHQKGAIRVDATTVENYDVIVLNDMPPNCIPGFDTQLRAALVATDSAVRASTGNSLTGARNYAHIADTHFLAGLKDVRVYIKS